MKKSLKILFVIEFILIAAIVALALIGNKQMPTAYVVKENPGLEEIKFKVLTRAVCEEKSEHIFCYDALFVKCKGKEYIVTNHTLDESVECGGIKINLSDIEVNGDTEFKKEWVDPRDNS